MILCNEVRPQKDGYHLFSTKGLINDINVFVAEKKVSKVRYPR